MIKRAIKFIKDVKSELDSDRKDMQERKARHDRWEAAGRPGLKPKK